MPQINPYSLALLFTAAIAAGLAVYALHKRIIAGSVAYILLMLAVVEWSLGYAAELAAPGLEAKLWWARVEYLGIVAAPYAWLAFALDYTGRRQGRSHGWLAGLAVMPLLTTLMVWTNDRHGLIWREIRLEGSDPFPALSMAYGPGFWLHTLYSYALVLAGTVLLARFFRRSQGVYRWQAGMVLLAAGIPWLGNAIYIFGLNPFPHLDLTPFAFTLTGLLAAWGFLRLQFLDILPIARDAVLESMPEAVVVLDQHDRIVDMNPSAEAFVRRKLVDIIGLPATQVFQEHLETVKSLLGQAETHAVLTGGSPQSPRYFHLRISPLTDRRGVYAGRLAVVHDISERQRTRLELERSHEELEQRVAERTAELGAANAQLQREVGERRAAEAALRYRLEIERLISGISTHFINIGIEEVDAQIERALQTVAEFAGVDRSYVFQFNEDGLAVDNTHEWCAAGISPEIENLQGLPCAEIPWWMNKLQRREPIHLPRVSDLPPQASREREILAAQQIQSLLAVPLMCGRALVGFLGFDSVREENTWAQEDILLLRLLGEIIASALSRRAAERLLVERNAALRAREAQLRAVFAAMQDTVLIVDREGYFTQVAPAHLDGGLAEGGQQRLDEIMPTETAGAVLERLRQALEAQKTVHLDYRMGAGKAWFAGAISPIDAQRAVLVARDITERKASEEELVFNALHDPLTGLPNRRLFMDRLERAFQRAKRHPEATAAVLFMDLDRFKAINDSLGHANGDRFLNIIAGRLQDGMRAGDTVARFGGDEFAILLEEVSGLGEAIGIAERVQQELSIPVMLEGQPVASSASIGIALALPGYQRPEEILRDADAAMYRAKLRGRGRHETFAGEALADDVGAHAPLGMDESLAHLEAELRGALERGEIQLFYQPVVELSSGRVTDVEALLRWLHPERGLLYPETFLSLAEASGASLEIGEWALRNACAQAQTWHKAGHTGLCVAVNLSTRQFRELRLLELVPKILEETGLAPQYLELEVSEGTAMQEAGPTQERLEGLRHMGVGITLDDFGSGYSSLRSLQSLPTHTIKIDRALVLDVSDGRNGGAVASAIIALAHQLRLRVVAEGVENSQQLAFLAAQACDGIQGFLVSQAVPAERVEALLSESRNSLLRVPV